MRCPGRAFGYAPRAMDSTRPNRAKSQRDPLGLPLLREAG